MKGHEKERSIEDFLADNLSKFPNDAEKERVLKNLNEIIRYFENMKKRVEALPNAKKQDEILSAIDTVKRFLETGKENPVLSIALGLQREKPESSKPKKETSLEEGKKLFNDLKKLPTEEIQKRLLDYKSISMDQLHALALFLRIRNHEKTGRQNLVDMIVKSGFANVRGYELLRADNTDKDY
jgi:exonuclease VII large subunit